MSKQLTPLPVQLFLDLESSVSRRSGLIRQVLNLTKFFLNALLHCRLADSKLFFDSVLPHWHQWRAIMSLGMTRSSRRSIKLQWKATPVAPSQKVCILHRAKHNSEFSRIEKTPRLLPKQIGSSFQFCRVSQSGGHHDLKVLPSQIENHYRLRFGSCPNPYQRYSPPKLIPWIQ